MDNTAQIPSTKKTPVLRTQRRFKWGARFLQYMDVGCLVILLIAIAMAAAFYFDVNFCKWGFRTRQLIAYMSTAVVLAGLFSIGVFRYVLRLRSLRFIFCYPSLTFVVVVLMGLSGWLLPATIIEKKCFTESYLVLGGAILLRGAWQALKQKLSSKPPVENLVAYIGSKTN